MTTAFPLLININ